MASADSATTVDAAPYIEQRMKSPAYRAARAQARAEIQFVDNVVNAVRERILELGLTVEELAEMSWQTERRVRRLFDDSKAHTAGLQTVSAVAAALGIELSVGVPAPSEQPADRQVAAVG